ncbi:MAG: pyridoxamine 5'-phosphate oxidase family protein [Thaumarchaeota archaeon]|nr:pyridoxamine 5'-phosphate oxidase family protein [Nitrososphaerota archaeon]MDD9808239.1 pyridoxamine 5'-phosphate oxidase family protein [Nitrososphaerota archaeon]MDD9814157.1 pyridoxamine 5'-phosphate oxidase family protein [Nitrososphaerota archaeon]
MRAGELMRLATSSPSGGPHVVPVWYELDGETVRVGTHSRTIKARNIESTGRAAFCVDVGVRSPGIRGVAGSGAARLVRDPAAVRGVARRIIARYIDADSDSARALLRETDCIIEILVERASSWEH